jgi:hypothetical protein
MFFLKYLRIVELSIKIGKNKNKDQFFQFVMNILVKEKKENEQQS